MRNGDLATMESKMAKQFPKGLDKRMRDRDGEIRKKRSDTLVKTLREEYGDNFAEGYRPNRCGAQEGRRTDAGPTAEEDASKDTLKAGPSTSRSS
jgi:hypothetical protein